MGTAFSKHGSWALALAGLVLLRRLLRDSRYRGTASLLYGLLALALKFKAPRRVVTGRGPMQLPLVGFAHRTGELRRDMFACVLGLSKEQNFESFEVSLPFGRNILFLHEEENRRHVLKGNWTNYVKNGEEESFGENLGEVLGEGIFAVDGKPWRVHRKVAAHMFSARLMREQMEVVMGKHAAELVEVLRAAQKSGKELDIQLLFQCFTFDAFCSIAFAVSPGALNAAHGAGDTRTHTTPSVGYPWSGAVVDARIPSFPHDFPSVRSEIRSTSPGTRASRTRLVAPSPRFDERRPPPVPPSPISWTPLIARGVRSHDTHKHVSARTSERTDAHLVTLIADLVALRSPREFRGNRVILPAHTVAPPALHRAQARRGSVPSDSSSRRRSGRPRDSLGSDRRGRCRRRRRCSTTMSSRSSRSGGPTS